MAKRFTDNQKWKQSFFKSLPVQYKLLYLYILDECDHAGIWEVEFDVAVLRIGEIVTAEQTMALFGNHIQIINETRWFVPSFIDFQYGQLNPKNKVHLSVMKLLASNNVTYKPLGSPLEEAKDKEQAMDKVKDKESLHQTSFTLQQVEDAGFKAGVSDAECKVFFTHYDSQGWLKGNGLPITNLASQLANWRNNGHKFDKPVAEPTKEDANIAQWEHRYGCYVRDTRPERVVNDLASNLKNPEFKEWATSTSQRLRDYYVTRG